MNLHQIKYRLNYVIGNFRVWKSYISPRATKDGLIRWFFWEMLSGKIELDGVKPLQLD